MNLLTTILPSMFHKFPKLTAGLVTAVLLTPIAHDVYTQIRNETRQESF